VHRPAAAFELYKDLARGPSSSSILSLTLPSLGRSVSPCAEAEEFGAGRRGQLQASNDGLASDEMY
jgi:hypothetical protein